MTTKLPYTRRTSAVTFEERCWLYAVEHQGFLGDFTAWEEMSEEERQGYEDGARVAVFPGFRFPTG